MHSPPGQVVQVAGELLKVTVDRPRVHHSSFSRQTSSLHRRRSCPVWTEPGRHLVDVRGTAVQ